MSRVGNRTIFVPENTTAIVNGKNFAAVGPKGELNYLIPNEISVAVTDGQIKVTRVDDSKTARSLHGTSARVISNLVTGVSEGFVKKLDYKGVGFTVAVADGQMNMRLGYSHPVVLTIPSDITVNVVKNTISVEGISKEAVGAFAAKIRETKKPEVYKGKGIKYQSEIIRKKAGKAAQSSSS